jgi:hypothetical protein
VQASSEPVSDPIARIDPSTPYSPAPLSYTRVAMSAVVIWKFRPNVPAQNTTAITSMMSGRERTYRRPSRRRPFVEVSCVAGVSSDARIRDSDTTTAP